MVEWLSVVDVIYEEIVVVIALSTGAAVIAYFRGILNRQKENTEAIQKLCKRSWRIERAFALFMKATITENKKNHKDSDYDEVDELVDIILKDNSEE